MALHYAKTSLEERLSGMSQGSASSLQKSLLENRRQEKRSPYLRADLAYEIVSYFENRGVQFAESRNETSALSSFRWEPLKPVEKGMRITGIPAEFLMRLDDYEKIYFFAGVYALPVDTSVQAMDSYEIASIYIRAGLDHVAMMHNTALAEHENRRTIQRGRRIVTYKEPWTPPYAKQVREKLLTRKQIGERVKSREDALVRRFDELFTLEDAYSTVLEKRASPGERDQIEQRLEELNERIGMQLDSLTSYQLDVVRRHHPEKLGDYAKQSR